MDTNGKHPALLFADGQYLLRWRENGAERLKFLSPVAVRAAFSLEAIDSGWLPPAARRWGIGLRGAWIVLFFPPTRYTLRLQQAEGVIEIVAPLPALLFVGYGRDYYVWAVKERELQPDATAFHAPLPNLDHQGRVCFGSNDLPQAASDTIEAAWKIFLASPFTEHGVDGKSRKHPADVRQQLWRLAQARRRAYPLGDLVSHRLTVSQIVQRTFYAPTG